MTIDGKCPECGSGDYSRDGNRVVCGTCGYRYQNIGGV